MLMISWEPWASDFEISDSIPELNKEKKILHYITQGTFDHYIKKMALKIKNHEDPVFLRFAHEFDNPDYPWSRKGENTPEEFKKAWQYVYHKFQELRVQNVIWVWNPWKDIAVESYYPGDDYVDWIGVTLLNYGELNSDSKWHEFESLYNPFHEKFKKLSYKPVMIAEMGTLNMKGNKKTWFKNAFKAIDSKYKEINGVVFFNSSFDKNIPKNNSNYTNEFLHWSFSNFDPKSFSFFKNKLPLKNTFISHNTIENNTYVPLKINTSIKGIGYEKYKSWTENNYVAKKSELIRDFRLMKELDINLLKYHESSIYDKNVLKYSKENNLNVFFSFDIPNTLDFIKDKTELEKIKKGIIEKIKRLNKYNHIKGWFLKDNIWYNFKYRYNHFEFIKQEKAYYIWLRGLIDEIKEIDNKRYILQEVELSQFTINRVKELKSIGVKIDAFGLNVQDDFYLNKFLKFTQLNNIQCLISSINTQNLLKNEEILANKSVIIKNWQNKWQYKDVTFNGLLDFRGKKKPSFFSLKRIWDNTNDSCIMPKIRILKPSLRLLEGDMVSYHALIMKNGQWSVIDDKNTQTKFEWIIAKYDKYGHALAIKPLGHGSKIDMKIPSEYTNYKLLLTYTEDDYSTSVITKLNTPLHSSIK